MKRQPAVEASPTLTTYKAVHACLPARQRCATSADRPAPPCGDKRPRCSCSCGCHPAGRCGQGWRVLVKLRLQFTSTYANCQGMQATAGYPWGQSSGESTGQPCRASCRVKPPARRCYPRRLRLPSPLRAPAPPGPQARRVAAPRRRCRQLPAALRVTTARGSAGCCIPPPSQGPLACKKEDRCEGRSSGGKGTHAGSCRSST